MKRCTHQLPASVAFPFLMANPNFAFRYARPCRTDKGAPACYCIIRFKNPLTSLQQRKKAASATPPAATAAAADPAPEAPKPPESANPAVGTAQAPFTPAEDVALLSLKAQNKTWKEIGDVLVGRDKDELRNRYKEIGGANGGGGSEAAKEDNGAAAAAQSNEGKGKQGKQKGDGGKKGKGKQGENKAEDTKDAPAATAAAAPTVTPAAPINAKEAVVANKNNAKIKGILRRGSDGAFQIEDARIPEGASTLNGSPIIYLDENDPLDIEEVSAHMFRHPRSREVIR